MSVVGSLYQMNLHDEMWQGNYHITRVPGGWIYKVTNYQGVSLLFIPFDNEFQEVKKSDGI